MKELMTAAEFIEYAAEVLNDEESLYERIAEVRSEVAMFGDAGPGACYRIIQSIRERNQIADRYQQLTGIEVKPMAIPYFGHR